MEENAKEEETRRDGGREEERAREYSTSGRGAHKTVYVKISCRADTEP